MAEIPEIHMSVEVDEEAKDRFVVAQKRFRDVTEEMNKATTELLNAARGLQFVVRKTDSDGYHDDQTLNKVHEVLRRIGYLPDDIPSAISEFQNAGILFRERR